MMMITAIGGLGSAVSSLQRGSGRRIYRRIFLEISWWVV